MTLACANVGINDAKAYVRAHHRHSVEPTGAKLAIAAIDAETGAVLGVALVGRPQARVLDDGYRLEVLRLCTPAEGGRRNVCSFLYARCARLAVALDLDDLLTYTRTDEDAASLRAAGWTPHDVVVRRKSWNTASRPREDRDERVNRYRWHAPSFPRDRAPRPRPVWAARSDRQETLPL